MTAPFDLTGRIALVTGASAGIGSHLARRLARAGAAVALGARRVERVEEIAAAIRADGGSALGVPLDVADEASVRAAYDAIEAQLGTVDTIVANAGVSSAGRATDVSADDLRTLIDTNFTGLFLSVREGARRMIAAGGAKAGNGRVVLLGSITAEMTGQGDSAYAASKAAVAHLGRQFAREWVRQGINVNTIQPGYIHTDINAYWFDTEPGKAQIANWHRRRLVPIEALDDVVLYLASDASRHVTGTTITIDDGQAL